MYEQLFNNCTHVVPVYYIAMISVTFCLAKSRHFYHILLYMFMCILVCIFYINNTTKGNTSLMLKVIEKCTNFYFGTEKLPPKF